MAPKQNFGKGSKVEEKKKNSTRGIGEITGVSKKALNVSLDWRKQWTVKWPDGTIESKTSAQLRRPVDKAAADSAISNIKTHTPQQTKKNQRKIGDNRTIIHVHGHGDHGHSQKAVLYQETLTIPPLVSSDDQECHPSLIIIIVI